MPFHAISSHGLFVFLTGFRMSGAGKEDVKMPLLVGSVDNAHPAFRTAAHHEYR
jgi:hypothetical protein